MDKPLPPLSDQAKQLKLGTYIHYKNIEVKLLAIARHSETLEELAVYQHVDDGNYWVRPLKMFSEEVEVNGELRPRFKFLHG